MQSLQYLALHLHYLAPSNSTTWHCTTPGKHWHKLYPALQVIPAYYDAKGALVQLGGQGGGHPGQVPGVPPVRLLASPAPPLPHQVLHLYTATPAVPLVPS